MENEVWVKLKGYKIEYQVSNKGRVKRSFNNSEVKPYDNGQGYLAVGLNKLPKGNCIKTVHSLVAICFLNHTPNGHKNVVNHKDHNRKNNNVENLEIITNRQNTSGNKKNKTSKYVGVYWNSRRLKWMSRIRVGKKHIYLGLFSTQEEAKKAYENKLIEIT